MADDKAEKNSQAEEPATEALPTQKAVAKPSVGPRRIPPRNESSSPKPTVAQAAPQRIGPPPEQKRPRKVGIRWVAALATAVVLIAAVGIAGFVYLSRDRADTSADASIRTSIDDFTKALTAGDLATLRTSSCGDLATFYQDIPDTEFADVHRVAVEQGNIPVVENVDAVQITGETAIAQVIAYTAANPTDRSPRTFDLRLDEDEWKVCSPQ